MTYSLKKTWLDFRLYADQIAEIEDVSFSSPWSTLAFEAEIKKSISNLWAIVKEKNILGYICFWMFDNEIHILNIAVHPQKRNKGLGKVLLKNVIEAGIEKGIDTLWLEVRPSNFSALSIYKKFGFVEVGHRVGYYSENKEDAIIMSLDI